MNKIKYLYDVVKTMRDKTMFNGLMKAQVQRDQQKVFSFENDFEKNLATGYTKAKISTELDYQGKLVKHSSNTEFALPSHCENGHHGFRHWHHPHARCMGIKEKLAKLSFALSLLNNLKIEERDNSTTLISLTMNEMPDDFKTLIQAKLARHADICQHSKRHAIMHEFCTMEEMDFVLNVFVNKNFEVETMVICLDGSCKDEENNQHTLKAVAELSFSW